MTDVVALITIAGLLVSIAVRLHLMAGRAFVPVLWVQVAIIVLLSFSLTWVYPTLDEVLGGHNYLNLIAHLIFLGATWVYNVVLSEPIFRGERTPVLLRSWVPVVAAIGCITCFVLLDPSTTSKGLDAFTDEPAWIGYWVFNVMTLWVPALTLVPRLLDIVKHTKIRPLLTAYWAMIVGYTASVLATLGYVITYFYPALFVGRELMVGVTQLCLVTAVIAIPVSSQQQKTERSARQQAQAEAAARFHN